MKLELRTVIKLCCLVSIFTSSFVCAIESQKRDLQWAYIMNFVHYITWPDVDVDPLIKVCLVGNNPFKVADGDMHFNEKTGSITIATQYNKLPEITVLAKCDLIYFAQEISLPQLSFVFSKLKSKPIVTIGDHRGFNKVGGLIQFIERNNKLGFRLNKSLLNSMDLKIHPSLMRLSD